MQTKSKSFLENLLQATIKPNGWTLKDWVILAELLDKKPMWGWYQYLEQCPAKDKLKILSIKEWEEIAQILEASEKWAYYQYKEYYNGTEPEDEELDFDDEDENFALFEI